MTEKLTRPAILVVEDDPALGAVLVEALKRSGHTCQRAASCAEGRKAMAEGRFACTLIDLGLPDGTGLDLLSSFREVDPTVISIILTGDANADTIIDTMRAGAFDYITKPVDMITLKAAVSRALAHHAVVSERAELVRLLLEEREQLRARIEAATADLRQYANACEVSNNRLRALLRLSQFSAISNYSDERLMRSTFDELGAHIPLQAIALCDVMRGHLLAVLRHNDGEIEYVSAEGVGGQGGYDYLLAEAEPQLLVQTWAERHTGLNTSAFSAFVFPQTFWNRLVCTVGFYLDPDFEGDAAEQEFLGMCAHYLAFQWEQANLLLHVAHHASLGNIAVELARNFIQPLTAIRTAADFIGEIEVLPEVVEGMQIIHNNVDRLRRQTQEFRRLSLMREGCVETVRLDEYVEQALSLLSVTIQNRDVAIVRDFKIDCECVLLNGSVLARTFLDLLLAALRAVDVGGRVTLTLREARQDRVAFEIAHAGGQSLIGGEEDLALSPTTLATPGLQLAQRTIHSCGGSLSVEQPGGNRTVIRVLLPRNVTNPAVVGEVST